MVVAYFTNPVVGMTKPSVMRVEPGTLGTRNYTASYCRRTTCSEYSVLRSTIQKLYGLIGGAELEGNRHVVQQNRDILTVVV